jgi:hypothetical protein
MPDSADHRVDMHRLGQQRLAAGLPMWDRKINVADVFHNDEMTFPQRRDAIVSRLRDSGWLHGRDEFDELVNAIDELAEAENSEEFDGWWDEIYDIAYEERVWISTF